MSIELSKMLSLIAEAEAMLAKMRAELPSLQANAELVAENAKKEEKPTKEKKPASGGTMAWHAFVAHAKETQPSRFAELKKRSDILQEAKSIREEDEAGYKQFIESWKKVSTASDTAPTSGEEIIQVPSVKEKKKPAVGTMIWHSWVKHCKDTNPDIAALTTIAERMQAIKTLKETDTMAYKTFSDEFKNSAKLIE